MKVLNGEIKSNQLNLNNNFSLPSQSEGNFPNSKRSERTIELNEMNGKMIGKKPLSRHFRLLILTQSEEQMNIHLECFIHEVDCQAKYRM
ncbi:unnamed protein product [Dovyalis caffra]|uniref:Uncharacterized protein n=1 Tax=Dovyalis caffra TaxID=77055 RepID=A0AAV1S1L6_9ROSI|nr:unnamed protein product [Dovyalis caffra]